MKLPENEQALHDLLQWFAHVPLAEQGDEHMQMLPGCAQVAAHLEVMSVEEHRSAISGAFVAAMHKQWPDPENVDLVLPVDLNEAQAICGSGDAYRVLLTSISMTPPETDISIDRPRQVDWLWMAWAVSRKKSLLSRLTALAMRTDSVGSHTVSLFEDNVAFPEMAAALLVVRRRRAPRSTQEHQGRTTEVKALAGRITTDRVWARRVWLVEFRNGRFTVVTDNGATPPACPFEWEGMPVKVRAPTRPERDARAKLNDLRNEP